MSSWRCADRRHVHLNFRHKPVRATFTRFRSGRAKSARVRNNKTILDIVLGELRRRVAISSTLSVYYSRFLLLLLLLINHWILLTDSRPSDCGVSVSRNPSDVSRDRVYRSSISLVRVFFSPVRVSFSGAPSANDDIIVRHVPSSTTKKNSRRVRVFVALNNEWIVFFFYVLNTPC